MGCSIASSPVHPGHRPQIPTMNSKMFLNNLPDRALINSDPKKNTRDQTNTGFVQNYAKLKPANPGDIMSGYTSDQLPVIYTLAKEFAVCDNWFSSLPGPTWPNRFFLHGGSSGGLDHSPSITETAEWETGVPGGFVFPNENVFDKLKNAGIPFRFYRGNKFLTDDYPIVSALKGIKPSQSHSIEQFEADLKSNYQSFYTFIEPSYGNILKNTYEGGTSQHPMDDIRGGEMLIKPNLRRP